MRRTTIATVFILLLAAVGVAAACSRDILGPGEVGYEKMCTIYVSEDEAANLMRTLRRRMTDEQMRICRPPLVIVVTFRMEVT